MSSRSAQVNEHCWLLSGSVNRWLLRAQSPSIPFYGSAIFQESSSSHSLFLPFLVHATCLLMSVFFFSMLWPVPFLLPFLSVSSLVWKEDFMTSGTDPTGVGNEEWPVDLPTCLPLCLSPCFSSWHSAVEKRYQGKFPLIFYSISPL